jgi:hypothetical protein
MAEKSKKNIPQTLLGELAEAKEAVARASQPGVHKQNEREV